MSNTTNFRDAIREAQSQHLVGPNVIANALPFVGGGLVLTAVGTTTTPKGEMMVIKPDKKIVKTSIKTANSIHFS